MTEGNESPLTEAQRAVWMANKALDVPNADPDDDLRTISRQFLRSIEQLKQRNKEIKKLKEALENIIPIIYNRVSPASYSRHDQDRKINQARKLL